jgi:hypothetical protein
MLVLRIDELRGRVVVIRNGTNFAMQVHAVMTRPFALPTTDRPGRPPPPLEPPLRLLLIFRSGPLRLGLVGGGTCACRGRRARRVGGCNHLDAAL